MQKFAYNFKRFTNCLKSIHELLRNPWNELCIFMEEQIGIE